MADTDKKETKRASDARALSIDQIQEERNLQKEITKLLKEQGNLYEEHTGNIGASVKKLTQIDILNAKIQKSTSVSNSLAAQGVKLANDMVIPKKKLSDLVKDRIETKLALDDLRKAMRDHRSGAAPLIDSAAVALLEKRIKAQQKLAVSAGGKVRRQSKKVNEIEEELRLTIEMRKQEEKSIAFDGMKITALGLINKLSSITLSLYKKIFDIFVKFDDEMFSLRTHFGLFRNESVVIESMAKSIAIKYAALGVTIEKSSGAIKAIGDSFGLMSSFTDEIAANIALFSTSLGISEKTSVSVLHTFASMSGKVLKDSNEGMMGFAASLSAAAGTNLNEVMSDIAQSSDSVRSTFRGNTIELIKATVEARRMGMSLGGMAKTSESLLDFNSSVNDEMEASVLLGKNLNFIEARRAAFNGDYRKQSVEILKVIQRAGDFDKMSMMQRQALAKAAGMSVGELQKMVQRKKEIDYIEKSGTRTQKEQLIRERKMLEMIETEAKDIGKMYDKRVLMESNQTRMNELQHRFNDLILRIGGPVLDMVENFARLALKILPDVNNQLGRTPDQIGAISAAWSVLGAVIIASAAWKVGAMITAGFVAVTAGFVAVTAGFVAVKTVVLTWIKGILPRLMGVGRSVLGLFRTIFSFLPSAAAIVWAMLYTVVGVTFYKLGNLIEKFLSGTTQSFSDAWIQMGDEIWEALMTPFNKFAEWVYDIGITGESPSELGLSIVDGILSVGTMLLDALMYPFKSAYTFITELFGKIPEFISSVFKRGIDFAMKLPGMGLLMKVVDKLSGTVSTTSTPVENKNPTNSKDTDQLVLAKLTELVDLMRAGGIVINLDGRKVSEALAHASR